MANDNAQQPVNASPRTSFVIPAAEQDAGVNVGRANAGGGREVQNSDVSDMKIDDEDTEMKDETVDGDVMMDDETDGDIEMDANVDAE